MVDKLYDDTMRTWAPQSQNLWDLTIQGVPNFENDSNILSLSLTTVDLPKETTDKITVPYMHSEMYYAGRTTYDAINIKFKDFVDPNIWKAIIGWRRMVWNPITMRAGLPADYKKIGSLTLYNPNFEVKRIIKLIGAFPLDMSPSSLDQGSSSQVEITVTLSIDKAIPDENLTP